MSTCVTMSTERLTSVLKFGINAVNAFFIENENKRFCFHAFDYVINIHCTNLLLIFYYSRYYRDIVMFFSHALLFSLAMGNASVMLFNKV